jgi:hypothetical protein
LANRSKTLIERYYEEEKLLFSKGYEVTLLISIATSLFCITKEKTKEDSDEVENIKKIFLTKFVASDLFSRITDNCKEGKLQGINNEEFFKNNPLKNSEKTLSGILGILRNSLAHGNIFFEGKDQISSIVFKSKENSKDSDLNKAIFKFIILDVCSFKDILIGYCQLLITNSCKPENASQQLEQLEAA